MTQPKHVIREIQREYVTLVRSHLGHDIGRLVGQSPEPLAGALTEAILASRQMASGMTPSSARSPLEANLASLPKLLDAFWREHSSDLCKSIQELPGLTLLLQFQSDVLVDGYSDKVRRLALYFDTVCIPDPIHLNPEIADLGGRPNIATALPTTLLKSIRILEMEPLLVADTDLPVCVIYPSSLYTGPDVVRRSERVFASVPALAASFVAEKLQLDAQPQSLVQLLDATSHLSIGDIQDIARRSGDDSFLRRLPAATMALRHMAPGMAANMEPLKERSHMVAAFYALAWSATRDIVYSDYECDTMAMDPLLTTRRVNWDIYRWLLPRRAGVTARYCGIEQEDVVSAAFQTTELRWLSNVSVEDLVRMREHGVMEDLRRVFRVNWRTLKKASLDDFPRVTFEVRQNVDRALAEYSLQAEREREAVRRRLRLGVINFALTGSLTLASVAFPTIMPLALVSAGVSLGFGGKSIRDIVNDRLSGKREIKELAGRPVGLLYSARAVGTTGEHRGDEP